MILKIIFCHIIPIIYDLSCTITALKTRHGVYNCPYTHPGIPLHEEALVKYNLFLISANL